MMRALPARALRRGPTRGAGRVLTRGLACALVSGLALTLAGCLSLEPRYERPAAPVPAAWPQGAAYPAPQAGAVAAPDIGWQAFFTDPKLRAVIAQALASNRDLRVAILDIEEARQQYRVQRADLFPGVNAGGNATYEHTPLGFAGGVATAPATTSGESSAGTGSTSTTSGAGASSSSATVLSSSEFIRLYSANLGVSNYELDLWGRVRSLTHQALDQYLATVEARRASQISIVAEVATDYLTLAADRQRLKIAQATLESDRRTLALTQARFNGGIASSLDVRQAATPLDQAQGAVATYTTQAAQDLNALNLVVGSAVPDDLLPDGQDDRLLTLPDLPAGLDSTVLLRRPDVMQAEDQLRGYNANIGAARAAFFPTITLTGSGGFTSLTLTDLFRSGSGTWTFAPDLTLPIFDAGRNRANLRYAKAERNVAVAQYEEAIQTAFRDVADALAQRGTIQSLIASQEALVGDASGSFRLSQARYQRGTDPFLNTLTAQITLFSAQQNLVSARLTRATNLVSLYRALGGGLDGPAPPPRHP